MLVTYLVSEFFVVCVGVSDFSIHAGEVEGFFQRSCDFLTFTYDRAGTNFYHGSDIFKTHKSVN
jgi:hypothetical protein